MLVFVVLRDLMWSRMRAWPLRLEREGGPALVQCDVIRVAAFPDCDPVAGPALEPDDVLPLDQPAAKTEECQNGVFNVIFTDRPQLRGLEVE